MDSPDKQALLGNVTQIVESLAEILLEDGVSFSEFSELARLAFTQAAEQVLGVEKRVTDSRIAVITGIHRKDVKRLRDTDGESFNPDNAKSNRAVAVISAWTREKGYCDSKGHPHPLAFDGDEPSLSALIKTFSGDMPVRAVCDELLRMGVIQERDNLWELKLPVFVPSKSRSAMLNYLGEDTTHLIKTIQHNLNNPPRNRRFQRSVSYDELSPESAALFQEFSSERAMDLLKEFDSWLAKREKNDKRARKKNPDTECRKAGLGIYFFEETPASSPDGDQ